MSISIQNAVSRMTMLSRNRKLEGWDSVNDVDAMFSRHQQMIIENWYMYYGLHNLFLKRFEREDDQSFAKRVSESTVENHVKPIINLMASYLYPEKTSIKRWVERDDVVDDKLGKFLKQSVWNHNKFYELDYGKALNAFVSGYTIVQKTLCDIRTDKIFNQYAPASEKSEFGYIKKELVDSSKCMPFPYVDENGVCYDNKLGALVFYTKSDNFVGIPKLMDLMEIKRNEVEKLEYVDDKVWLRWIKKATNQDWVQVDVNVGTEFLNKNPFGDVNIPFTIYKNTGDPFLLVGISEVDAMRTINLAINELGSGDDSTIRYHSFPILLAMNGAKIPNNFVRTKDAVIEDGSKLGKIEYLTWDNKLDASGTRQDTLRRMMSSVTGVSLITRGFLKDIGQIRSGPPLKALFTSDRALMSTKFAVFADSEAADMKSDVLFFDKVCGTSHPIDKTVTFHAKYEQDFLGIDALLNAEINQIKQQYGEDVEDILKGEHPDWSEAQIAESVKKYEEQKNQKLKAGMGPKVQSSEKKSSQQN